MSPHTACTIVREVLPDGVVVLHIAGVLDEHGRTRFKAHVADLLEDGARHIVLDCTPTTYISSAGLGYLVGVRKRVAERGGQLVVAGLNDDLLALFRVSRLTSLFVVAPGLAEALAALPAPAPVAAPVAASLVA